MSLIIIQPLVPLRHGHPLSGVFTEGSRVTEPPLQNLFKKMKNKLKYIFSELAMLNIHREVEITVDRVIRGVGQKIETTGIYFITILYNI
jgi:hypothetical protein